MEVYLYLIGGIAIGCLSTWMILQRRSPEVAMSGDEEMRFKDNVSRLITEFNKVSNTNINVLEDKIRDIREAVEMADERIIRINSSLSDMSIISRRIQESPPEGLSLPEGRPLMPLREIQRRSGGTKAQVVSLPETIPAKEAETGDRSRSTVDISLPAAVPLSTVIPMEEEAALANESVLPPVPEAEGLLPVLPQIIGKTLVPLREIKTKAEKHKDALPSTRRGKGVQLPESIPSPIPEPHPASPRGKTKKGKETAPLIKEEKPVLTPLPRTATKEEKREVINELISAGFSVEEISRAVGLSQTEVQLILGLKKKRA